MSPNQWQLQGTVPQSQRPVQCHYNRLGAAGFMDCVQIRFATEHVIFADGIAVQSHMGGADLESETSEKLPRAVQSASHPAKPSRRALFLPSGLPHKNVD